MQNGGQLGGVRLPPALKPDFWRQVPLSGEESPPQRPCHICQNAKCTSQLRVSRGPPPKRVGPNDGFSGRLHRL
jgi:hypothetical protein